MQTEIGYRVLRDQGYGRVDTRNFDTAEEAHAGLSFIDYVS